MVSPYRRLLKIPEATFFLLGIRGVGKSTWAGDHFQSAVRVNLLDETLYQQLLTNPAPFREIVSTAAPGSWVIVDEVQRLPSLLNEIQRSIDERKCKFVLLGSSARKLRRAGVNLLGGRALQKFMHPFLPAELGVDFNLEKILSIGSVPIIWMSPDPIEQLRGYVQLYLKEEIQAEAIVRNLPGFARFLPIAALFHAQILNVDSLARDAGVARTTVQGYIEILQDTLLAFKLPAFEGRLRVREKKSPKLYWVDPGIARAAKRQYGPVAIEERGALFKGFVIQFVRAMRDAQKVDFDDMYYWSAGKGSHEVDLLLTRGEELLAIEIKSANKMQNDMFGGLSAISELPKVKRRILVYLGERSFVHESGVEVFTFEKFAEEVARGL